MRFTYHDTRTYHTPSIQGLQAIDLSTEVRYAPVIDKHDGDIVFTVNAVVEHFDEFHGVKRYTQDDWETLPRHPVEIQSFDSTETVEAFPVYPGEVLYVAKQDLTPRAPDITPIEVFDDDGMESFPDPTGHADISDFSFYDSDPYSSNYNTMCSMANRWTLSQMNKDIRLQPPFFALPKEPFLSSNKMDPSTAQLTMFLLCVNHRTEHESTPHFAGVSGVAVERPVEFLKRFSAALL
ncbi:hypothetical protein BGZ47_005166 [Haplosporangium gracile]|nr:hypothetical protein BGZ47_005166 [Haplosporangium gracile]